MIFGILWSIRKLEIRRTPQPPQIDTAGFEQWQGRALFAYNLGIFACFGKIVLDYGFQYFAGRMQLSWSLVRAVGATLFFLWLGALVASVLLARRARLDAARLGIESRGPAAESPPTEKDV